MMLVFGSEKLCQKDVRYPGQQLHVHFIHTLLIFSPMEVLLLDVASKLKL